MERRGTALLCPQIYCIETRSVIEIGVAILCWGGLDARIFEDADCTRGSYPSTSRYTAPGLHPGANGHEACFKQALYRLAISFNGIAGCEAFEKAKCRLYKGVRPID